MKYIIYGPLQTYHTFPNYITHKKMARKLGVKPTSAGFCEGKLEVFGESESLKLKSKEEDNEILNLEEL